MRVSSAGAPDAAAVEAMLGDTRLYATTGTVTILTVDGGHITGVIDARDASPPGEGAIGAPFDVTVQ